MSKDEYRWHWRCTQCGKESPSNTKYCPRCNALLAIHGKAIPDDPEPDIPRKPIADDDAQEQQKKTEAQTKEPKQKERKRREPKKRNRAGLIILIVLLMLVILALGALVLILLGREATEEPTLDQPPAAQTTPADTEPAPTTDAQTDPPDTDPPETEPPETEPPETEPPVTEPPETEPPETEPALAPNTLSATIYGEEITFLLNNTTITSSEISVSYKAYNPRGEERYYISLEFDKNYVVGTYHTTGDILTSKVTITFAKANTNSDFYRSYRKYGDNSEITGTFIIEKMSDDWMSYDGSFSVELVLYGTNDSIVIDDAVFHFTLEES